MFAAVETLRYARTLQHTQSSNQALFGDGNPEFNTLNEILRQRLHKLGFEVSADAVAVDSLWRFAFLTCSLQEFILRARWTWTQVLARSVRHRKSFAQFAHVDLPATRSAYRKFDPYD